MAARKPNKGQKAFGHAITVLQNDNSFRCTAVRVETSRVQMTVGPAIARMPEKITHTDLSSQRRSTISTKPNASNMRLQVATTDMPLKITHTNFRSKC